MVPGQNRCAATAVACGWPPVHMTPIDRRDPSVSRACQPQPRAAIYARVSTYEHAKKQLLELTAYARRRGFRLAYQLVDKEGGATEDRKKRGRLMDLASRRQVDAVLVWKFDRFARSSKQLLTALEEFRTLGVDFIGFTENASTPRHPWARRSLRWRRPSPNSKGCNSGIDVI